jgi:ABC-type branched-subunit amino acid transport system substrate-binding protein
MLLTAANSSDSPREVKRPLNAAPIGPVRVSGEAGQAIRLGGVGPLNPPGIGWAGRELLAGMELAVEDVNSGGGIDGRPLELLFEDTRGFAAAGVEALERLRSAGACALVGEFHSVVADGLAERADRARLPFLCSSATLDAVTGRRSPFVFRLAPPQSYGWRRYAEFLFEAGFRHVIEIIREDIYWNSGASVLRGRLEPAGVRVSRVVVAPEERSSSVAEQVEALTGNTSPAIALLLVGYPEPLGGIVRALANRDLLTATVALGDPAGRAVFPDWWDTVDQHGVNVPFLSYQVPGRLTQIGNKASTTFQERHGREPSFIALEGYDAIAVTAAALKQAPRLDAESICRCLRVTETPGTRGLVRFSTEPDGVVHQQWAWPPVCVAARGDPARSLSEADLLWDFAE